MPPAGKSGKVAAMGLTTTTIGAYPKPDYVEIPDWFRAPAGPDTHDPTAGWAHANAPARASRRTSWTVTGRPPPGILAGSLGADRAAVRAGFPVRGWFR